MVATRAEESKAQLINLGLLAALFAGAYLNSRREDSGEDARIKREVQRLVRLKKEFDGEGADDGEGSLSDDGMAAALRAAQAKMSENTSDEAANEEEGQTPGDTEGSQG